MFAPIKRYLKLLTLIVLLFGFMVQPSHAITAKEVPHPPANSYTVDLANIIDSDTEIELNRAIATLQQHKNKSIYIVTVPAITKAKTSTSKKFRILSNTSASRKFLNSIFSNWTIKQLHQGNSIFIVIFLKEQKVEIKTGFNLRYVTKDRHIQSVIDKIIIPKFKQHNPNQGILLGTKTLIDKIENPYTDLMLKPNNLKLVGKQYKNKALCQTWQSTFWCSTEGRDRGGQGNW